MTLQVSNGVLDNPSPPSNLYGELKNHIELPLNFAAICGRFAGGAVGIEAHSDSYWITMDNLQWVKQTFDSTDTELDFSTNILICKYSASPQTTVKFTHFIADVDNKKFYRFNCDSSKLELCELSGDEMDWNNLLYIFGNYGYIYAVTKTKVMEGGNDENTLGNVWSTPFDNEITGLFEGEFIKVDRFDGYNGYCGENVQNTGHEILLPSQHQMLCVLSKVNSVLPAFNFQTGSDVYEFKKFYAINYYNWSGNSVVYECVGQSVDNKFLFIADSSKFYEDTNTSHIAKDNAIVGYNYNQKLYHILTSSYSGNPVAYAYGDDQTGSNELVYTGSMNITNASKYNKSYFYAGYIDGDYTFYFNTFGDFVYTDGSLHDSGHGVFEIASLPKTSCVGDCEVVGEYGIGFRLYSDKYPVPLYAEDGINFKDNTLEKFSTNDYKFYMQSSNYNIGNGGTRLCTYVYKNPMTQNIYFIDMCKRDSQIIMFKSNYGNFTTSVITSAETWTTGIETLSVCPIYDEDNNLINILGLGKGNNKLWSFYDSTTGLDQISYVEEYTLPTTNFIGIAQGKLYKTILAWGNTAYRWWSDPTDLTSTQGSNTSSMDYTNDFAILRSDDIEEIVVVCRSNSSNYIYTYSFRTNPSLTGYLQGGSSSTFSTTSAVDSMWLIPKNTPGWGDSAYVLSSVSDLGSILCQPVIFIPKYLLVTSGRIRGYNPNSSSQIGTINFYRSLKISTTYNNGPYYCILEKDGTILYALTYSSFKSDLSKSEKLIDRMYLDDTKQWQSNGGIFEDILDLSGFNFYTPENIPSQIDVALSQSVEGA